VKLLALLTSFLALFPHCTGNRVQEKQSLDFMEEKEDTSFVIDLNKSTKIIMKLIEKNDLAKVLEDTGQEGIDLLIKNFSPSEMAFEADVLNSINPAFVLFFKAKNSGLKNVLDTLEINAKALEGTVRFVKIDAEELFKIASISEIDTFPTMLLIKNREEVERWEGQESIDAAISKQLAC